MKNPIKLLAVLLAIVLALMVPSSIAFADNVQPVPSGNGLTQSQSNDPGTPGNPKSEDVDNGSDNGANQPGDFDSTPSNGNNQGNGNAPENGSVGNADDKNPPGQSNNDHNNGYECDNNNGVGNDGGNPAHTGCDDATVPTQAPTEAPTQTPEDKKVTICHATGSDSNPYVTITVSESAVEAHRHHQNVEDIIPMPASGCPKPVTPTVAPTTAAPTVSPTVEPTPVLPTEEPVPTLVPVPGPTEPTDSPSPVPTVPTESPTVSPSPEPTPTISPTPTPEVCDIAAVGRFANASALDATLTVTVNGKVVPFGLTAVDGTPLPGVFTVPAGVFEFPGIIHLENLKPGDVVAVSITNGRTSDFDTGVVRDSCGVGVEVGLVDFVGPVPVPPVPPIVCQELVVCVPPTEKPTPPTHTVVIRKHSDTSTVTTVSDGTLPYTGSNEGLLAVAGALMIVAGAGTLALTRRA